MQVTAKIQDECDGYKDDGRYIPPIVFDFVGHVSATFAPEQGRTDWDEIANSIERGVAESFEWGCGNGESSIEIYRCPKTNSMLARFTVAKYGDGCGGMLYITVEGRDVIGAFRQAGELTREFMGL